MSTKYDIGQDFNSVGIEVFEEVLKKRVSDEDFRKMAQSLNKKQMEFYHILKKVKTSNDQLMLFLSGGAGVSKTGLTECIHQALILYLNRKDCICIKWKYNPYKTSHSCESRFPISLIEV